MRLYKPVHHQRGAALLLIAAALVVAAAAISYAVFGGLGNKLKRQNAQEVSQVLADAKQSLLSFAGSIPQLYPNNCAGQACGVGFLPSPDSNNDGAPDGNTANIVGRLPMSQAGANYFSFSVRDRRNLNQFLDTPYPIWYALPSTMGAGLNPLNIQASSTWNGNKPLNSNVMTQMFNSLPLLVCTVQPNGICLDSNGSGTAATTSPVVALLFYAGSPLTGQARPSNNVVDYLDMSNGDGDRIFLQAFPTGQTCQANLNNAQACFNDIVLPITLADWIAAMESRVKVEFTNLNTTLCSTAWRNANNTHWAVTNQWQNVVSLCTNPNLP
jgi:hypothetical protein